MQLVWLYDLLQMLSAVKKYHRVHYDGQLSTTLATRLPSSVHSAPPAPQPNTLAPPPLTPVTPCHLTLKFRSPYFLFPCPPENTDPCPADT